MWKIRFDSRSGCCYPLPVLEIGPLQPPRPTFRHITTNIECAPPNAVSATLQHNLEHRIFLSEIGFIFVNMKFPHYAPRHKPSRPLRPPKILVLLKPFGEASAWGLSDIKLSSSTLQTVDCRCHFVCIPLKIPYFKRRRCVFTVSVSLRN